MNIESLDQQTTCRKYKNNLTDTPTSIFEDLFKKVFDSTTLSSFQVMACVIVLMFFVFLLLHKTRTALAHGQPGVS